MDTLVYFANKIVYFLIYFGLLTIALSITLKILIKSSHNTKLKELIIGLLNNNGKIFRIIVDILEILGIYYLNYLKYGFILYTKVVSNAWYIKVICNLTNIFLIILTILIGFVHLRYLISTSERKK